MKRGWSDDGGSCESSSSEFDDIAGASGRGDAVGDCAAAAMVELDDVDMRDDDGGDDGSPCAHAPAHTAAAAAAAECRGGAPQQHRRRSTKRACAAGVGPGCTDADVEAFVASLSRADLAAAGGAAVPRETWRALCDLNACVRDAQHSEWGG